jgi:predicted secreted protein
MKRLMLISLLCLVPLFYSCKEKTVKYSDSGKTIHLAVNQILKVQLPGDATSSSDWRQVAYNDSVLMRKGKSNYMLGDGTSSEPGLYTFRFTAIAPGKSKLIMEYGHKYDADKPASRKFELDVIVVDKQPEEAKE